MLSPDYQSYCNSSTVTLGADVGDGNGVSFPVDRFRIGGTIQETMGGIVMDLTLKARHGYQVVLSYSQVLASIGLALVALRFLVPPLQSATVSSP